MISNDLGEVRRETGRKVEEEGLERAVVNDNNSLLPLNLACVTLSPMRDWEIPVRQSVPPVFAVAIGNDLFPNAAGEVWHLLQRHCAPNDDQLRDTILAIRTKLSWSRAMLAALMGVPISTLRRWETGERSPSGAARRLIWMIGLLVCEPHRLKDGGLAFLSWGHGEELEAIGGGRLPRAHRTLNARRRDDGGPPTSEASAVAGARAEGIAAVAVDAAPPATR